jgi:hypothetical protein
MHLKAFVLAALAAAVATPGLAQAPILDPISMRLLVAHNRERTLAGVPPLQWDPVLAAAAAAYGQTLAATGRLQHSPRAARPGQRENLWMGTRGAFSPEQMIASWTAEKRLFRPGIFPAVSATGNWLDVSHYSTMIWSTTTRIGCAIRGGRSMDFLVCRYSPPGNIDGQRVP